MRYTAASSLVSMPTSRSGGMTPRPPDLAMICSSTAGASLQPQPPPCERLVSGTVILRVFLSRQSSCGLHEVARVKRREFSGFRVRKSQPLESRLPSLVHILNESKHALRPLPQRFVLPRPGGHQQQRVEHLVVQA